MKNVKIAPSVLSADFADLKNDLLAIENAGADIHHLDVMDGHFVPNLTFGLPIIDAIRRFSRIPLDVHLMVTNPESYIDPLVKIGVDYISFHLETGCHHDRLIQQIKENNCKAGIVLNPGTSVSMLDSLLNIVDFVLVMTVNPGFGGQKFIPYGLDKIQKLKHIRNEKKLSFEIEVDGGVNDLIAPSLINNGCDILVAGSYIYSSADYQESIGRLRSCSQI